MVHANLCIHKLLIHVIVFTDLKLAILVLLIHLGSCL